MGLHVHSLSRLPLGLEKEYYLYILDYGWDEPFSAALVANFRKMAELAAMNKAIVLAGTDARLFAEDFLSVHFNNEQLSWSNVNGENGEEVLPAIMISSIHPQKFRSNFPDYKLPKVGKGIADEKMILIPLRGVCKDASEVIVLIEKIFRDIAAKKPLQNFSIAKKINANEGGAFWDAIILKPSIYGIGIDVKESLKFWKSIKS